jgi:hypothetical protein
MFFSILVTTTSDTEVDGKSKINCLQVNQEHIDSASGTDNPKQINGKNVVGKKCIVFLVLFSSSIMNLYK